MGNGSGDLQFVCMGGGVVNWWFCGDWQRRVNCSNAVTIFPHNAVNTFSVSLFLSLPPSSSLSRNAVKAFSRIGLSLHPPIYLPIYPSMYRSTVNTANARKISDPAKRISDPTKKNHFYESHSL